MIARDPREPVAARSRFRDALARVVRNRLAYGAGVGVLLLIAMSVLGPVIMDLVFDVDPAAQNITYGPRAPSWRHPFGTDLLGRDLLARVLQGGRLSLMVALVATVMSLSIGVTYGAIAGYVGGRVDNFMMRVVDVLYALPYLFLVIVLMVFVRALRAELALPSEWTWLLHPSVVLFIALGAVQWLTMARIVRGQVLSLKSREFVAAARTIGVTAPGIVARHLIPNTLGPVVVYTTLTVPSVILQEAFLSFLGLGIEPPDTSWGTLVNDGARAMMVYPWLLIFPAGFLAATIFCLNAFGDGLRDALDPQMRKE